MSAAFTSHGPRFSMVSRFRSSPWRRKARSLRLRMISSTSSLTPSIVSYSWYLPAKFTRTTAAPGIAERSTRRRALPKVVANPRSSGSMTILPCVSESSSTLIAVGKTSSFITSLLA